MQHHPQFTDVHPYVMGSKELILRICGVSFHGSSDMTPTEVSNFIKGIAKGEKPTAEVSSKGNSHVRIHLSIAWAGRIVKFVSDDSLKSVAFAGKIADKIHRWEHVRVYDPVNCR